MEIWREQCAGRIGCKAYKPEHAKDQIMCSHSDCPNKGFFCMIPGCKRSCDHRYAVMDSVECDTDGGYATIISGKWKEIGTAPGNAWREKGADHS
jgi:hypothetical protein